MKCISRAILALTCATFFMSCLLVTSELAPPVDLHAALAPEIHTNNGAVPSHTTSVPHRNTDDPSAPTSTSTSSPSSSSAPPPPPPSQLNTENADSHSADLDEIPNISIRNAEQPKYDSKYEENAPQTKPKSVDEESIGAALISQLSLLDAMSTNSGINGIPDVPAAPSLVTLIERAADINIDQHSLDDDLDDIVGNSTHPKSQAPAVTATPKDTEQLEMFPDTPSFQESAAASDEPYHEATSVPPRDRIATDEVLVNMINDSGGEPLADEAMVIISTDPNQAHKPVDTMHNEAATENLTRVEETQIPLFSEWAQKRMEEAEKELEQDAVNSSTMKKNATASHKIATVLKMRAKNYASPDCGAKIIAANSEASNTREVLTATKDEYLLSPCNSRIWFVVELCEAIQAEIIDLANFELFSSSPKNFSVAVSNRFPTRDWSQVGKFEARDERNIQSFDLYPHMFGKYVRVDIHSHYSSEHFCPISLFRVFGTSEFEAFETENRLLTDDGSDDDSADDELEAAAAAKEHSSNIFKSASDAVMSIVKKAAATFVKPSDNMTEDTLVSVSRPAPSQLCVSLSHLVICKRCTENLTEAVTLVLGCKQTELLGLLDVELIRTSVSRSQICANLVGVDLSDCKVDYTLIETYREYVSHMFPVRYVAAMCNLLANGLVRRPAGQNDRLDNDDVTLTNITIDKKAGVDSAADRKLLLPAQQPRIPKRKNDVSDVVTEKRPVVVVEVVKTLPSPYFDGNADPLEVPDKDAQISPTKVVDESPPTQIQAPPVIGFNEQQQTIVVPTEDGAEQVITTDTSHLDAAASNEAMEDFKTLAEMADWEASIDGVAAVTTTVTPETLDLGIAEETVTANGGATVPQPGQKVQSESVFLRLSNRVKSLERNMSLSGQYLEELSRRYKKQVEELQTAFSKTLLIVEEQNKRSHDREQLLYEQNLKLREDLDELTDKIFSWTNILFYVTAFACIQIVVIWLILRMWSRRCYRHHEAVAYSPSSATGSSASKHGDSKNTSPKIRRKSTDGSTGHIATLSKKQRRPSEEALNIVGTYAELLISEENAIYNATPDAEEYDQFIEAGRRKNGRNKKNVKRAISLGSGGLVGERKKLLQRQDSAPGAFERLKQQQLHCVEGGDSANPSIRLDQPPMLDEDYEIYVPGTDFAYNEFMPDGPSGQSTPVDTVNVNGIGVDASTPSLNSGVTGKPKSRRLSSPAFLKSPFSRSSANSKKKPPAVHHETATGWEWYRQKSSQSKKSKAKVEANHTKGTNGHNGNATVRNNSSDSVRTGSTTTTTTATNVSTTSDKKQGSFRRILNKVF